jgi:hypothetical protein
MYELLVGFAFLRGQKSQSIPQMVGLPMILDLIPPEDAMLRCGQVKPAAAFTAPDRTGCEKNRRRAYNQ